MQRKYFHRLYEENSQYQRYFCEKTNERKLLSRITSWNSRIQRKLVCHVKQRIRRWISDILIRIGDEDVGIVIEVKWASDGDLEKECEKVLQQIIGVRYTESLEQEGIHKIIKYGNCML